MLILITCMVLVTAITCFSKDKFEKGDRDATTSDTPDTHITEMIEATTSAETDPTTTSKIEESVKDVTTYVEEYVVEEPKIKTREKIGEVVQTKRISFNAKDTDLLLRIGMCEAGGEKVECIASVMRVVLNRVSSNAFPNSIYDVIYEHNQFTPAQTGWIKTVTPSKKCQQALDMVLDGWDESQNALYFESCNGDSWHSRNLKYLYSCGNMNFYK